MAQRTKTRWMVLHYFWGSIRPGLRRCSTAATLSASTVIDSFRDTDTPKLSLQPSMRFVPSRKPYARNLTPNQSADKSVVSVGQDRSDKIHIIDLSAAGVDCLQQFINLFIAHLFAQVCQDVSQLPNSDEPSHVFIKYLEAATVFFWFARVSESTGSVEDFAE